MEELVHVKVQGVELEGALNLPEKAEGLVLFAHGSGSSRHSPRNVFVAKVLNKAGLATLLIDLLSEEEDATYATRFDIDLLEERLKAIIQWLKKEEKTKKLSIGLFGASTGAAGALRAAASLGSEIKAVVSRGGRPDLAEPVLDKVLSPTLIIVGGDDFGVIELNEGAYRLLKSKKEMKIIPGATHLFEEPGTLEEVARLSQEWFKKYLLLSFGK